MTDATFVPADFDPSDFANIEPLGKALLDRDLVSVDDLRRWIADLSELFAAVNEAGSRRHIDNACHTEDEDKEQALMHWIQQVQPKIEPLFFELQKKYLASPAIEDLNDAADALMAKRWKADVELFREENIALDTRDTELSTEYGKIQGAMLVTFRDQEMTLQQLARYLEETDRSTRQEAWQLSTGRRLEDRERIENLFEEQLKIRHDIATNADHTDFRSYMWAAKKRFDYTPDDCLDFGRSVERVCMPLIEKWDARRHELLGVDTYRPWDGSVDPLGRAPLRPFDPADTDGFVAKTRDVFERFAPDFGEQLWSLRTHGDLDLDSRPGKRPGGFQASLEQSKRPFIFMNAAGLQRDVETLLHEGGHAFHYLASRNIENLFLRHAPLEFCEVASMSQELLGCDHFEVFYGDPAESARARKQQLEGAIRVLPWVATIDGFQHWLYTHPGHSADERADAWSGLLDRFGSKRIDWAGHEDARRWMWQRQGHLFQVPFYYIEYGIAQLGALGVWLNFQENAGRALDQLRAAFALGGTRPLPELFEAAGVRFDFGAETIGRLVAAVENEIDKLPD